MLLPKDYIWSKLSGEISSDVSDASDTSFFDVGRRRCSEEMLATFNVPRVWLPEETEYLESIMLSALLKQLSQGFQPINR